MNRLPEFAVYDVVIDGERYSAMDVLVVCAIVLVGILCVYFARRA